MAKIFVFLHCSKCGHRWEDTELETTACPNCKVPRIPRDR